MGNSLCGNDHCSSHIQLGNHGAIDIKRKEDEINEEDGGLKQGWNVSYNVFKLNCTLILERIHDKHGHFNELFFELNDSMCFNSGIRIWVEKVESNFVDVYYEFDQKFRDMMLFKTKEIVDPRGSVMKTNVFCYGRGMRGGLVIVQWKRKKVGDRNPNSATVAHYYAVRSGNAFSEIDVGLSLVVKIGVVNSNLIYKVKGPDRHPSSALCYMFEQVCRTGNWNIRACPHCVDDDEGEWSGCESEESGEESDEIESEESENENENEDDRKKVSPVPGPQGKRRLEVITNKDINGNGNGNRVKGDQKFKISFPIHFGKKLYYPRAKS